MENTKITRRGAMAVLGSIAVAGCSTDSLSGGTGPEYDEDLELPMLTLNDFPDGWKELDSEDYHEDWEVGFSTEDEDVVVYASAKVYETISDAEDEMDRMRETAREEEFSVADDAIWMEDGGAAYAAFRDSNAVAQVLAANRNGLQWEADVNRATQFAQTLYGRWGGE